MKTKTLVKAGSLTANHNRKLVAVKSAIKAGSLALNHSVRFISA